MVKKVLSLTEIISLGEYYLEGENLLKYQNIALEIVKRFELDNVYEALKEKDEWFEWSTLDEKPKFFLQKVVKKPGKKLSAKVFLMDWSGKKNRRCPVVKIVYDVY